MNREAKVAAKWWADQLRNGVKHDAGDKIINAFQNMAAFCAFQPTPEQIDLFESVLVSVVQDTFIDTDLWRKAIADNCPQWGSGFRTLAVDYGACDELRAASQMAGFPIKGPEVFPIKTCMWVNPGSVKVSAGYRGETQELMTEG